MKSTTNYQLVKQELTDKADITQISGNWDTIDTQLKNLSDGKFDKTGGTVNGAVTVNGNLTTEGDKIFMKHKTMPAARSTEPAADVVYYAHIDIMNSGGYDYYTNRMGKFEYSRSAGLSRIYMQANNPTNDSAEQGATIGVGWRKNSSGVYEAYTQTLTPPVGDNSTQIATTAWVKALRSSETEYGLVRLASESDVLQETDKVVMDVPLAYELNDFRRMNKAYEVGDRVNCAFRFEHFLECTQAGTTSGESLDTRNVTHGQEITDGTAKWTVRTHVRSIGGAVANENGDVEAPYLSLSGGTITGNIIFSNDIDSFDYGYSWANRTGPLLALRGANYKNNPSAFELIARSPQNDTALVGNSTGTLTWGGKTVECVDSLNNDYIRLVSGLQICFGEFTISENNLSQLFNLPVPFANNNYKIVVTYIDGYTQNQTVIGAEVVNKSTFSASIIEAVSKRVNWGRAFSYIAIGLWK